MLTLRSPKHEKRAATQTRPALDEASFDALFKECFRDVYSYAASLLGDVSAAEDVTALAFERLYRSRVRFDARRGSPRALLFAIARNAALDELRRRRRHPESPLTIDPIDDDGGSDDDNRGVGAHGGARTLEEASGREARRARSRAAEPRDAEMRAQQETEEIERREIVRAALMTLPAREREVVLLKFHGGLTNAELATALGISVGNAGTRLHRALTRLREMCFDLDAKEAA